MYRNVSTEMSPDRNGQTEMSCDGNGLTETTRLNRPDRIGKTEKSRTRSRYHWRMSLHQLCLTQGTYAGNAAL